MDFPKVHLCTGMMSRPGSGVINSMRIISLVTLEICNALKSGQHSMLVRTQPRRASLR